VLGSLHKGIYAMLIIREIGQQESERWDAYVTAHDLSIYFLYIWRTVFTNAYQLASVYLAAFNGDVLVGILPAVIVTSLSGKKRYVSLPFLCSGGLAADTPAIADALCEALAKRGDIQVRQTASLTARGLFLDSDNVRFTIPISGDEHRLFHALGHTARKHINKSLRHNFTYTWGPDELSAFYGVYQRRMRELGTPCHSLNFWHSILEAFPAAASILTVRQGDVVVAGMFCLYTKQVFHDVLAVALHAYRDSCVYYFLHWQALRFAVDHGCAVFDFERSQTGTGTYTFKKQWGAIEHPLYYYNSRPGSIAALKKSWGWGTTLWRLQPLWLANFFGPHIRKYFP